MLKSFQFSAGQAISPSFRLSLKLKTPLKIIRIFNKITFQNFRHFFETFELISSIKLPVNQLLLRESTETLPGKGLPKLNEAT